MQDSKPGVIREAAALDQANPEGAVAIPPHVHNWEACRVGMNVTDYSMCTVCEEIDPPIPPRVVQLVPEVIDAINAETERQRKAAPFLDQYERGLLTVAELISELVGTMVAPVEPTYKITTLDD